MDRGGNVKPDAIAALLGNGDGQGDQLFLLGAKRAGGEGGVVQGVKTLGGLGLLR